MTIPARDAARAVPTPRLVLAGGGHSHLLVLAAYARRPWPCASLVLVSDAEEHAYSGMIPGYIEGRYSRRDVTVDLPRLAQASGARFVRGAVSRIDVAVREIVLEDGARMPYDVASVAIGSRVAGAQLPGISTHAHFVKPISAAVELLRALDEALRGGARSMLRVLVVGGGAAGVEVALAIRARARLAGAAALQLTLIEAGSGAAASPAFWSSGQVGIALARAGVDRELGAEAVGADRGRLHLRDGRTLPFELLVWTTGPAAPAVFRESGLPTDAAGYLMVDETLRVTGIPRLFAAGDSASLRAHPRTAKAGVYAVRMGPVLRHNLEATCRHGDDAALRAYRPQSRFLALLNAGDGRAVASWGGVAFTGKWALRLKHRIDRGFMARFQDLYR